MSGVSKLLLALVLTACAGPGRLETRPNKDYGPEIDPDLYFEVEQFLIDCLGHSCSLRDWNKITSIRFGVTRTDNEPNDIGYCLTEWRGDAVWKEIVISREDNKPGTYQLLSTVYHEMGHCLLNKEHDPSMPYKIMNPRSTSESYLGEHWDELVKQFFGG